MSDWRSPGYSQTDEDPVVCISHEDAKDYTAWLSRETGHSYRLPSEAEWEYAARANTRSARYWGASADRACRYENVHDRTSLRVNKFQWTSHDCEDGYAQTSPVGKFGANAFGLYDMLGNVREWTEDCWNESYAGAPPNTKVWAAGDCSRFVVRGGSWNYNPRVARSAFRDWSGSDYRTDDNGFRVARVLQ
ncbi:MAG: SUMF1/EgtB/PvdO family nonheme iron enzyme, partial [Alphaproteobacteria bacterium]|jgi:formylglycine-generating enzyme required for sulfatase activity|nr:SUMF1/EgtB/PvdO family nonheme iron enzyme [Alphaproteobacteria bacterium]